MRWIWIDQFESFESGKRAVAVKNVSLAEEHLHDHFPGFPIMPSSLIVEGMAQTAGILVGESKQFVEKVILAKIKRAVFHSLVRPGQQLRYDASIETLTDSAAATVGRVLRDGQTIAEIDLVFSHIDQNMSGLDFPEENFVFGEDFLSLLRTYRAGAAQRIPL